MSVEPSTGAICYLPAATSPKKNVSPSLQQPLTPQLRVTTATSLFMLEFLTGLILYRPCGGDQSCYEFICVLCKSCPETNISQPSSSSFIPLAPFLSTFLGLEEVEYWFECPIFGWAFTLTCSKHFEQLWFSELTTTHLEKMLLEQMLRAPLIYECKHKYLKGNWTTPWLGKP